VAGRNGERNTADTKVQEGLGAGLNIKLEEASGNREGQGNNPTLFFQGRTKKDANGGGPADEFPPTEKRKSSKNQGWEAEGMGGENQTIKAMRGKTK